MLRYLRILLLCTALILTATVSAQEDLGWLIGLLPSGDETSIEKLLRQSEMPLTVGQPLLEVSFDSPEAWAVRNSNYGFLRIENGQYLVNSDLQDVRMTGVSGPVFRNVLIEAQTQQLSSDTSNAYGLMCRANASGEGYYFFISGDGNYSIAQQIGNTYFEIADWAASPAIQQGTGAENKLAVICFEDYLAFYVNDTLLTQVRTGDFREGQAGIAGVTFVDGVAVETTFDNLRVTELLPPGGIASTPEPAGNQQELVNMLAAGSQPIEVLRLLEQEPFDQQGAWEMYEDEDGNRVAVEDGLLRVISTVGDGFIYRSQNTTRYTDIIVQVETNQTSTEPDNGFGIICRASPQRTGRGYYLYISGDGYASMITGDGTEYRYAVEWQTSSAINQVGRNVLTAVCVQDYLALYANGTLLFETRDGLYTSGNVGFSALGFPAGAYTEIEFDNVRIWEARPAR